MIRVAAVGLAGVLAGLTFLVTIGCTSVHPLDDAAIASNPVLADIQEAFVAAVDSAYADPDYQWHAGWAGNIVANVAGDRHRGLCHEWQSWVYQEVRDTVQWHGWRIVGITINLGTEAEHHAVVVYDPLDVEQDGLLPEPDGPAWVLDAWKHGEPNIYRLDEWLHKPWFIFKPASLETPDPI